MEQSKFCGPYADLRKLDLSSTICSGRRVQYSRRRVSIASTGPCLTDLAGALAPYEVQEQAACAPSRRK